MEAKSSGMDLARMELSDAVEEKRRRSVGPGMVAGTSLWVVTVIGLSTAAARLMPATSRASIAMTKGSWRTTEADAAVSQVRVRGGALPGCRSQQMVQVWDGQEVLKNYM
jgi:hypothetical protein